MVGDGVVGAEPHPELGRGVVHLSIASVLWGYTRGNGVILFQSPGAIDQDAIHNERIHRASICAHTTGVPDGNPRALHGDEIEDRRGGLFRTDNRP